MCDNQSIVFGWQGQCSRDSHIMNLMCTRFQFATQHPSPRQNQITSRSHLLQTIHHILLLHRHSDSPPRLMAYSTPFNSTAATLASPLPCPLHKTVISHRDQVLHSFFPWQPEGPLGPFINISLVGPQPIAIHLSILCSFAVPRQIGLLGGFYLGCYPCRTSLKANPIGASAPKRSELMQP